MHAAAAAAAVFPAAPRGPCCCFAFGSGGGALWVFSVGVGGWRGVGVRCFSAGLKGQANIDSPLPPLLCSGTIKHIFVLAPHQ